MTVYWLDADACIQTKNEDTGTYPFSRCEKFWAYLSHKVDEKIVQCPKIVYDEIVRGNDRLAEWFKEREHRGLCIHPSQEVWDCLIQIGDYVVKNYKDRRSRSFLSGGDAFVIAHALAMRPDGIVVSHEGPKQQNTIVKIPAICADLGVKQISFNRMVNLLGDYRG